MLALSALFALAPHDTTAFRMATSKSPRFSFHQQVVAIRSDLAVDTSSELNREHLIAEEMVTDDLSASLLADRF